MENFIQWLEATHAEDIKVIYYDKTGKITFLVKGKRYSYLMDAGYFYNGFFSNWIRYKPGKALNFAKTHGKLIEPRIEKTKVKQQSLFPY